MKRLSNGFFHEKIKIGSNVKNFLTSATTTGGSLASISSSEDWESLEEPAGGRLKASWDGNKISGMTEVVKGSRWDWIDEARSSSPSSSIT